MSITVASSAAVYEADTYCWDTSMGEIIKAFGDNKSITQILLSLSLSRSQVHVS